MRRRGFAAFAKISKVSKASKISKVSKISLQVVVIVAVALMGACSADDVPEIPIGSDGFPDPQLVTGRQVYIARCANCHGNDGGGGRGTKLSEGRMVAQYPDFDDQVRVVAEGVRSMPGFAEVLEPNEIDAVVRYTREVL